jgi:tetratricopeptide (TPR) repeat protein
LQGLDPQSRSVLAEKILERHVAAHRIPTIREDADFARLMKLLAGYPLAMEVVLANLKQQSPKEILEKLQAADVNLDSKRESGDKTESILKCVEYSHSNLSTEAQKLLLFLAPFSGLINREPILSYIKQLQKLEPFKDYAFGNFDMAIQEAINWELLSPIDDNIPHLVRIQPVFPYFLKVKLSTLDDATRDALREGFKNHYQAGAVYYQQLMDSKNPKERQVGQLLCRLEYENLYNALQICFERQESIRIFFCLDKYFELTNDRQSRLKLAEMVSQSLEKYSPAFLESQLGYQIAMAVDRLASCYIETKQYQLAKQSYQNALQLYKSLSDIEERERQLSIAATYHQLGMIAQELHEFEEARSNYQLALEIYIEFNDRFSQAATYHQLGYVAQELREFEQAKRNYQLALEIKREFSDRYNQASTYHQLGMVAQELREFEQAKRNYRQALAIFIEFGDRYSQSNVYHQLGTIAQELCQFAQARRDFQQALEISIEFNDRFSQAGTYQGLGIVTAKLGEFEEARRNFHQALEIFIEFCDHFGQAKTYAVLGLLAEAQEDYTEARANLQKTLEIYVEYKDEYWAAIAQQALERLPDSPENQD